MGYTMLWPTPLIENNQPNYSYHGYAATDLYKIDARFGSNEDYRRMVALARQKGIGIIQDIVLNHIGSGHWWIQDLPAPDWLTNGGRFVPTEHFRTAVSDPYASQADKRNFTEGWFTENMPDMNQRNPLVATYQIQNSIWWIEYAGLAGVRVDTYGYSDTAFLSEWSRRVMQEYPKFNIVGEEWSGNPVVVSYWLRGHRNRDGFVSHTPGMMDFPLHEALRRALVADDGMFTGLSDLYAALANDQLYPEPMNMVLFEGNHDVPRLFSVMREDLALTKMALAYVLTMPRVPQLYYGTDVLMTSPTQRDDGATRRDYPGGWAGDTVSGFTGAGLSAEQKEMQAFLKRLLNWRKGQPAIHRGKLMHYAPDRGTYAWFRYDGTRRVMVVINKSRQAVPLATARFEEALAGRRTGTDVLTGQVHDLAGTLDVPARSVLVLELK
jgi:glycosidase